MYEVKEVTSTGGEKYFDVVWKENTIRYYENRNPAGEEPNYVPITELTSDEVRRMKYVYQRMHGGYRSDEKTYLEYYVLGELLMQFKRYLPTLLKNYGQSRSTIEAYGMYKPKMVDGKVEMKDGVEVVEWVSRIVEGRFKVLAGFMLNLLSVRKNAGENLNWKDKFLTTMGFDELESYSWKELPSHAREQLIDALTTGLFMLTV